MRALLAPLLAALALCSVNHGRAETLLDNVDGTTLDRQGRTVHFNGLVIDRDGRIKQVLGRKDKRPKAPDYKIDGKGRFVIPGLIDSHLRLMPMALATLAAEAVGTPEDGDLPRARAEDRDVAFAKMQRRLAALGITAVADMGTTIEDWQTYRRAGDAGQLYLRIMAYAADIPAMALIAGPRPTPWLYDDRLRLNGVHFTLDGSFIDRAAALRAPYADAPETRGKATLDETQLRNLMSRAAMDGFQVAVTAHGDAALDSAAGAIAELAESYAGDRRWRIEDVETADPLLLAGLGSSGVILSLSPGSLGDHARLALERLGPERSAMVQPWRALDRAKMKLVFGSGDSRRPAAPLDGLAAVITREDGQAQFLGGWQPQERLTREEAFAAYTSGAARAGFAEGRFGTLQPGERADFLMLEVDPMLAPPSQLRTLRVLETWIGGRKIYDASQPPPAAMRGPGQSLREPQGASVPPTLPPQPLPHPPALPAGR